jgi:hypothetical protein
MDYEILFDFIPKENKKHFLAWDNAFLSGTYIVAIYRVPFEERIFVPLSEYELRLKQKERNNKLNKLGLC